ncbi:MAG: ribbon-helix-helix domain-containing protein [Nanoarchaeota archaeon]|jgi:antitoxin ParD1/3/4|nr:ribbon-helix-helix domain-containing protein [Nanoarchaeota archaeon]
MEMKIVQARLPEGLILELENLVKIGHYSNKSEVLREALRDLILKKSVGILKSNSNSVKEIRKVRQKLSKEKFDLGKINRLAD